MTAAIVFTIQSPERGWRPFLAWLRTQGLVPADVVAITVHDDGTAVATVLRRTHGQPQVVDGELATRNQRIDRITEPPPLHPSRQESP